MARFSSPRPMRVRWVSEDAHWLAVEGSDTGIPMSEVSVKSAPMQMPPFPTPFSPPVPPNVLRETPANAAEPGFDVWFRAKVGPGKQVQILYCGEDELGAKEIEKLISILQAQKAALEDYATKSPALGGACRAAWPTFAYCKVGQGVSYLPEGSIAPDGEPSSAIANAATSALDRRDARDLNLASFCVANFCKASLSASSPVKEEGLGRAVIKCVSTL